jgi:hypothetical protein
MWIKTARLSKITIGKTWLESCAVAAPPAIVEDDFTTFIVFDFLPLDMFGWEEKKISPPFDH